MLGLCKNIPHIVRTLLGVQTSCEQEINQGIFGGPNCGLYKKGFGNDDSQRMSRSYRIQQICMTSLPGLAHELSGEVGTEIMVATCFS